MTDTPDTKENPSASKDFYWRCPSTYPWIVFGVSGLIGLLLGFTYRADVIPPQAQFFATNLLSVLALIVIIVQAHYYGKQRDIMRQQWQAMRDTMVHSQRAYISVNPQGNLQPNVFRVDFHNSGNTPAYSVEIFANTDYLPKDAELPLADVKWCEPLGILGPRRTNGRAYHVDRDIPDNEVQAFQNDELRFFCWGVVKYRDIFKENRDVSFALYQISGDGRIYHRAKGNDAS